MRLSKVILLIGLLLASIGSAFADTKDAASSPLLPDRVGKLRKVSSSKSAATSELMDANPVAAEESEYLANGSRVVVEMIRFNQDAYAYELLSLRAARARQRHPGLEIQPGYGTVGFVSDDEFAFFKGTHFVAVRPANPANPIDAATRDALMSELSGKLDNGEADIPVLIKHLPRAEEAQKNAVYVHSFEDLSRLGIQQAGVFSAIQADRNADAVIATYGPSKVVIVEFNTPQLATENDKRIIVRIQELWKLGQPAPTAYKRVGNYSVFVFDAPDDQAAKQLIDQVKYEQVVQWLGENPNIYKEAEKHYINTTLGVLVAVIKASGYAIILCLGTGGLLGALLFSYRRAQQKNVTAYSDAGGMLRLNLDELTPETNPARLLSERN